MAHYAYVTDQFYEKLFSQYSNSLSKELVDNSKNIEYQF